MPAGWGRNGPGTGLGHGTVLCPQAGTRGCSKSPPLPGPCVLFGHQSESWGWGCSGQELAAPPGR